MTLQKLILYIGIAAVLLTVLIGLTKKGHKSWVMTFLQNFSGILFIVSGMVKAVDPIGTAFKMEQYFAEFQYTFADTAFKFLAPVFPFLSSISLVFSIVMIVFEIVLGIMLLMGHKSKLTSWLFLLLVLFFTVLTGFTFLTGYVPGGTNFFQFASWGPYTATNMRVTDCGCFGDFIKLDPKISFYKDLVLLIPALYFVFRHRDMHQLFTPRVRNIIIGAATVLLTLFCLKNSVWGLPVIDFRPFKVGTNIYEKKMAEQEAAANVKITLRLQNNASGEIVELSQDQYMKDWQKYPKEEWKVIEQIKGKPAIEPSKISDFSVIDHDGYDVSEDILTDSGHVFLIIAYKLKGEAQTTQVAVTDTVWAIDTIRFVESDSITVVRSIDTITTRNETREVYVWDDSYLRDYIEKINPLISQVMTQGARVYAIAGGAGTEMLDSFKAASQSPYDWYEADDILLKTMIRSNPGVMHLKAGTVIDMWHKNHLPKVIQLN